MADVRALLRAKRQEARISHPAAVYTEDGQLRCSTCHISIKQASMWQGHVGSKAHRVNASRLRAKAEAEAEAEAQRQLEEQNGTSSPPPEKRQASEDSEDDISPEPKRRRVGDEEDHTMDVTEPTPAPAPIIPFGTSLASRLPPVRGTTSSALPSFSTPLPSISTTTENAPSILPKTKIDEEFEMFERELAMDDTEKEEQRQEAFSRATVMAEPELVEDQEDDFIPIPQKSAAGPTSAEDDAQKTEQQQENETRAQREKEDLELIMDRLLEEERAQEEADSRVGMLKSRLEMLKKQRAARKTKS